MTRIPLILALCVATAACFSKPGFSGGGEVDAGTDAGVDAPGCTPAVPPPTPTRLSFRRLAAHATHTCAIDDTGAAGQGRMWCWGENTSGELGRAQPAQSGAPLQVGMLATWLDVAVGTFHSCGITTAASGPNQVRCWGSNTNRQVSPGGLPSVSAVTQVDLGATFNPVRVFAGGLAACALDASGAARCWGVFEPPAAALTTPVALDVGGDTAFAEIGFGSAHTCVRTTTGAVRCWGGNPFLQLGVTGAASLTRAQASNKPGPYTSLAVEGVNTCAVMGGALHCWGRGATELLGSNTTADSADNLVPSATDVVQVALAPEHVCFVTTIGEVRCYGVDMAGALGRGVFDEGGAAVATVQGASGISFASVAVGLHFTCGLDALGRASCWGYNGHGELGIGDASPRLAVPGDVLIPVGSCEHVTKLVAGNRHACALIEDATTATRLYCWGDGELGQVDPRGTGLFATPVQITDPSGVPLTDVVEVAAGGEHTCARRADGSLQCWGANGYGQLGEGTVNGVVTIASAPWTHVAAGSLTTCAIDAAGALHCWGEVPGSGGGSAQHGVGPVDGGRWESVDIGSTGSEPGRTGEGYVLGRVRRTADSSLHVYGFGDGCAVGASAGSTVVATAPTEVLGTVGFTAINVAAADQSGGHACAHFTAGGGPQLYCWGRNDASQVTPTSAECVAPTVVTAPGGAWRLPTAGVAGVAIGASHSAALRGDGALFAWGANFDGELGDLGSTTTSPTPMAAPTVNRFAELATGVHFTCATDDVRTRVVCWGRNRAGELGNGIRDHNTPAQAGLTTP